ncbi:MAG TPA: hypothetical protein PKL48_15405, partial [Thermodesulfobacteriota bacterium]|nr:hypothetical protein [Thermodesulfobacteriota bacterium]
HICPEILRLSPQNDSIGLLPLTHAVGVIIPRRRRAARQLFIPRRRRDFFDVVQSNRSTMEES